MPRMVDDAEAGLHERIHKAVSRIPRGRVATYGQIARIAGLPGQARLVGYAMHALPQGSAVPWQRVVNAKGEISIPGENGAWQRRLLEREGVRFDARGRIALATYQWRPGGGAGTGDGGWGMGDGGWGTRANLKSEDETR